MAEWKLMFPSAPIRQVRPDLLEIGIPGEGSVFVQNLKLAAGLPRLMIFAKIPLEKQNSTHEIHWYRAVQILNTDILGATLIYTNHDPAMGQPMLQLRSSIPVGPARIAVELMALYCEVAAIFESKRILLDVLSVSLKDGILRADMYDKSEGLARSSIQIINPGVESVGPVGGKGVWTSLLEKARGSFGGMHFTPKASLVEVTHGEGVSGFIGYHEETHVLTLEHHVPDQITKALFGTRSSFEVSELLNILHTLHPMGCFGFDSPSGALKYGSLFRLLKEPTLTDLELLAEEMDAVRVVLEEVLKYQQELEREGALSAA